MFRCFTSLLFLCFLFCISECQKSSLLVTGSTLTQPLFFQLSQQSPSDSYAVTYLAKNTYTGLESLVSDTQSPAPTISTSDIYYPEVLSEFQISDSNLSKTVVPSEVICLPYAATGMVFVYNLPGWCSPLTLTLDLVLGIWNGSITHWDDPRLLEYTYFLPKKLPIQPIIRTDRSGTTTWLTEFLSFTSPRFEKKYGVSATASWNNFSHTLPITSQEQVLQVVEQTEGSIGYVGWASLLAAQRQGLVSKSKVRFSAFVDFRERSGEHRIGYTVKCTDLTIQTAVNSWFGQVKNNLTSDLTTDFPSSLMHPFYAPGPNAWPYVGFVYGCLLRNQSFVDATSSELLFEDVYDFVKAQSSNVGADSSSDLGLGFISLPEEVSNKALNLLKIHLRCGPDGSSCFSAFSPYGVIVVRMSLVFLFIFLLLGGCVILSGIFTKRSLFPTMHGLQEHSTVAKSVRESDVAAPRHRLRRNSSSLLLDGEDYVRSSSNSLSSIRVLGATLDLGDITLTEQIGSGSFSEVYRGKWLGTEVAIKRFLVSKAKAHVYEEFRKEATLLRNLRHPNIVQFLGTHISRTHLYIITEYCVRGNLQQIIRDDAFKLTLRKTISFALDVARGMEYLHSLAILHRDFKSSNLLVDKNWTVKIADFGLSRIMDRQSEMSTCGTVETCAPEILSCQAYTEKADVYSFGIVFYEMLTRKELYPGMNFFEISKKVVDERYRPDINEVPDGPRIDVAKALVMRCWQHNPTTRPKFSEIVEILAKLYKYLDDLARQKSLSTVRRRSTTPRVVASPRHQRDPRGSTVIIADSFEKESMMQRYLAQGASFDSAASSFTDDDSEMEHPTLVESRTKRLRQPQWGGDAELGSSIREADLEGLFTPGSYDVFYASPDPEDVPPSRELFVDDGVERGKTTPEREDEEMMRRFRTFGKVDDDEVAGHMEKGSLGSEGGSGRGARSPDRMTEDDLGGDLVTPASSSDDEPDLGLL